MRDNPYLSLTVVGEGSCRVELEDYAAKLSVRFVGFSNTPSAYFNEADLLVLPSFGPEGLPLVCLEAMAHGLPCLLSDIEVHRELSENGKLAALFPVGNSAELGNSLDEILYNPSVLQRYAKEAYSTLLLKYSESAAREAYLKAFRLDPFGEI